MKSFKVLGISAVRIIDDLFLDHHILIAGYASGYARNPGDIHMDERAFKETAALAKRLCELIDSTNNNQT